MANPTASDIQAAINAIDAQIAQLQKGAVFDGRTRARVVELQQERDELARALPLAGGASNLPIIFKDYQGQGAAAQPQQGGLTLDDLVAQMMAEGGTDPLAQSKFDWQKQQDELSQQNWLSQFGYGQGQDELSQQNWLQQWQAQQEQIKAQQAYQQQQLAQAWALAQAQLAQQQQEMAAGIGQQVAGLQSQAWSQALPYVLPSGTQHAPGYGYGGPVNVLANIAGAAYKPQKLAVSNPPSADQMMAWISQAMQQFGG